MKLQAICRLLLRWQTDKSVETTRQSYIKPKSKAEVREKINQLREQKAQENQSDNQ